MLYIVIVVGVLLFTVDRWFAFLMNAGVKTFWTLSSIFLTGFIYSIYLNPLMLLVPLFFVAAVMLYAFVYYHLFDRPRVENDLPDPGKS